MSAHALLYRQQPPAALDRPSLLYKLGVQLRAAGRQDEAIAAVDEALQLRPAFPEALRAGGEILRDKGAHDGALRFFAEAIRLRPAYRDAVLDHGNLLYELGRHEEALAAYRAALVHLPGDAGLLTNVGTVLHELGRLAEARPVLEAAVAADPGSAEAHLNHGNVLARLFEHAAALPAYERALALQPDYPAAHTGRGLALKMLGRFAEAAAPFEAALALEPTNPFALKNRGELRLLQGDYGRGLPDYEARLETFRLELPGLGRRVMPWSGEDVAGRHVLAIADDGLGDVIHFARFVPRLVAAAGQVTVLCRPHLQRLLRAATAGARVVADVRTDEGYDLLLPFSSMPLAFAVRPETLPGESEAYLAAEPDRAAHWAERLGAGGFKVGVCWRGSQDWRADANRSYPLASLAPLAALPGVRLISLQRAEGAPWRPDFPLEIFDDVDSGEDSFVDTAALMANLDLVVTCDTSVAHLAGALARPTFVLLRTVPEWRWMLERDDSPWYPTMRLFRQRRPGAWDEVLARVAEAVAARRALAERSAGL